MAQKKLFDMKRVSNSSTMIRSAFSNVDCLTCGVCCYPPKDEKNFTIGIPGADKFRDTLLQRAKKNPRAKIELLQNHAFTITGQNFCAFLEKAKGQNKCKVCPIRPMICLMFPFTISTAEVATSDDVQDRTFVNLSDDCPPIKALADNGVAYLTYKEISSSGENALQFLFEPLSVLMDYAKQGIFQKQNLLMVNDEVIFPLF